MLSAIQRAQFALSLAEVRGLRVLVDLFGFSIADFRPEVGESAAELAEIFESASEVLSAAAFFAPVQRSRRGQLVVTWQSKGYLS
jgi:hypothetical protein